MGRDKQAEKDATTLGGQHIFCYYCDRDFDGVKALVKHQRRDHFKCRDSGRIFDSVLGLRVHLLNAYKRSLKEIPNSIPGRERPDIAVHGMEGLPKGALEEKMRKKAEQAELENKDKSKRTPAAESKGSWTQVIAATAPVLTTAAMLESKTNVASAAKAEASAHSDHAAVGSARPSAEEAEIPLLELSPAMTLLLPPDRLQEEESVQHLRVRGQLVQQPLARMHPVALHALAARGLLRAGEGGESPINAALEAATAAANVPSHQKQLHQPLQQEQALPQEQPQQSQQSQQPQQLPPQQLPQSQQQPHQLQQHVAPQQQLQQPVQQQQPSQQTQQPSPQPQPSFIFMPGGLGSVAVHAAPGMSFPSIGSAMPSQQTLQQAGQQQQQLPLAGMPSNIGSGPLPGMHQSVGAGGFVVQGQPSLVMACGVGYGACGSALPAQQLGTSYAVGQPGLGSTTGPMTNGLGAGNIAPPTSMPGVGPQMTGPPSVPLGMVPAPPPPGGISSAFEPPEKRMRMAVPA